MLKIIVLCTGNSCRSVLGEALINHLGAGRFQAVSAGSHPTGKVNPNALATLQRNGLPSEGFTSQSWDEFADQDIDIAITVCDQAAGEACPAYLNSTVRAHWGLPDPAHATGTEEDIAQAFQATYDALQIRINKMLALPVETLKAAELTRLLNQIGTEPGI
ncbi:MAG: arsenate reductase ArsC [Methylovulum sp.]|nr:arsenate reductase ArsC [Methylovulum sp.]